ncbi:serine/threonine protein kinase [Isosphaera pallida ATCC 43644]|uniref:Serine/threonine protein kinase n=1 Tax=Isosphaera pallida (strain ATCC 43644 / DSM 9630 / IS1B) TaxID=575540 RepID=E8QY31_ISOPI|nr:serine/threonine-protein kinase [Isosphaera pallida]ADV62021.1 serine/threonine protein kinase [Isosphaera pallida ATCC 43644]
MERIPPPRDPLPPPGSPASSERPSTSRSPGPLLTPPEVPIELPGGLDTLSVPGLATGRGRILSPPPPTHFLRAVAHAVMDLVGDEIVLRDVVIMEALTALAEHVWANWGVPLDERTRRLELKTLATLPAEGIRPTVQQIVQEFAADRSPKVRQILTTYLCLVPSQIRQALKRLADPTGTTIPSKLMPRSAEKLLIFLPIDIPIFEPGDRPLPGVDWVLTELLGVGGFGEVWKAVNPHFSCIEPVVLKFYLGRVANDNVAFLHEAAMLNRAMPNGIHPGLVELRTTYLSADPPCLEYEYIGDGDLAQIIQERSGRGGLSPRSATKLLLQLTRTVGHFHRMDPPIVHRDLKPANILVKRTSQGKIRLKIIDFGIGGLAASKEIEKYKKLSSRGFILNTAIQGSHTPLYASPEQIRGNPPDPRDDVHALGVIWYQMVTGDLSQGAPTGLDWVGELMERGLTEEQVNLFASCFASRCERRPRDAFELGERLEKIMPDLEKPRGKHSHSRGKPLGWSSGALGLASKLLWSGGRGSSEDARSSTPLPPPHAAGKLLPAHSRGPTPPTPTAGVSSSELSAHSTSAILGEIAPPFTKLKRDGQGLAIAGPVGDDVAVRLLIAALRQQVPSKAKPLCHQLEGSLRIGYFSKQLIWNLSKYCHIESPIREISQTIARKLFGSVPRQFINERDLPIPDLETAERLYDLWRDAVCKASGP